MVTIHPQFFYSVGVVILAGGMSQRMNYPKAFLDINGQTLLESIHDNYRLFTEKIEVVLNARFGSGNWQSLYGDLSGKMNIQLNPHPEYGRFFSIQLGLAKMKGMDFCFLQNIDTPVSPDVIRQMIAQKKSNGYSVPVYEGKGGHPVLISRPIMNAILDTGPGEYILSDFLKKFPRTEVRVDDPGVLLNLNTETDYRNYISA